MLNDLRYALRQLRQAPGFALTAILTLALGIGATTAIFSIVEGVLLRPLPFANPGQLVTFGDTLEGVDLGAIAVSAAEMLQYMREAKGFSSIGGYRMTAYELSGVGEPAQVNASRVTASLFPTLGVAPVLGRVFTPQEDEGRGQVAVLSYQTWKGRFHGDPGVLGTTIQLDRRPYQIVGVMPRDFEFPLMPGQLNRNEIWVPMSLTQDEVSSGQGNWSFSMVGRLKPGMTPAQAQQSAQLVTNEIMSGFPAAMASIKIHATVQPLDESTVAAARPLIHTLFLAVAVVLFIACANLAGLLLVRGLRRRRETSVRLALGASGATIVRQNLTESLLLSVAGGLFGLALASVVLRIGLSFLPETLPRIGSISIDWKVAVFALLLAILTGLFCGLAPALAAARTGVNEALKEGGRTGTGGAGNARLRSALVIAELAVALVLLSGAGLLLRSFEKLQQVDLGFRTDHVLIASYSLPRQQYSTQASVDQFDSALLDKLKALPGVQAAGITTDLPADGDISNTGFYPEGYAPPQGATGLTTGWAAQTVGNYFEAARIPILRGRVFTDADRAGSPLVVIVNHALAEHYWPGQDPIGKRIHLGVKESPLPWVTVVGEIADIRETSPDQTTRPQFYQPAGQFKETLGPFAGNLLGGKDGTIVLRSSLPPDAMKDSLLSVVRSIDPQLPLMQVESMDQVVAGSQAPRRFNTAVIASFAAAAVLLAVLGIYSVIAFSAAMRTQEMAIRLALGAQRTGILRLVIVSGAKLGLLGCGIGVVASIFATRLLSTLLFEVDPLDPLVLTFAALAIFVLVLAASLVPARRAAAIEPMRALRME